MDGNHRAKPTFAVTSRGGIWSLAVGIVVSAVAAALCFATFGFATTGDAEATTERPAPIVEEESPLGKEWVWKLQAKTFDYMWRIPR